MKKLLPVVATLSGLLFLMVGCGGEKKNPIPSDVVWPQDGEGMAGEVRLEVEEADERGVDAQPLPDLVEQVEVTGEDFLEDEGTVLPPSLSFCVATASGCVSDVQLCLTMDDDQNPDKIGLQTNFTVFVENIPLGKTVEVWIDGILTASQKIPSQQFDISDITITHKPAPEYHQVELKVPGVTFDQKLICADTGQCGITISPKNDQCISSDSDPGTPGLQVVFTLTSDGTDCNEAWIDFAGKEYPQGHAELDETGSADVVVTLSESESLTCLAADITAHIVDSNNPDREVQIELSYLADTTPPMVTFTAPTDLTVNFMDDADSNPDNGLQVEVSAIVTGTGGGGIVELLVDSEVVQTEPSQDGEFEFTVSFTEPGGHAVAVRATDCCQNVGEQVLNMLAVFSDSDVSIAHPQMGAVLLAKDDGVKDETLSYETTFSVFSPVSKPGDILTVECRKDVQGSYFVPVGELTITQETPDWIYSVPVVLDVEALSSKVICHAIARDGAPKFSPYVALTVALPPPLLTIESPSNGELVDPALFSVSGYAQNLEGQDVTINVAGLKSGKFTTKATASGYLFVGALEGFPEGAYTVAVDAVDHFGNKASEQEGAAEPVGFLLDSTAPQLAFVFPLDGLVCTPVTCPDAIPEDVMTGHQTEVAILVEGEQAPELVTVCLSANGAPLLPCVTPVAEAGHYLAHFYGVTLVPGDNLLTAVATDGLGHESDAVAAMVTLEIDAPRVLFITPAQDISTATEPVQVTASVTSPDGMTALEDALVTIFVGGNEGDSSNAGPGGKYEFAVSGLVPDAPVTLQLKAQHASYALAGYSDIRKVTLKKSAPSITITSPADGAVFNKVSGECAAGTPGCQLTVWGKTANIEPNQTATLVVECGGQAAVEYQASVAANVVKWKGVVLPDNSSCTLTAAATDVIGQTVYSPPVSVTVDRTAPVIKAFHDPPTALVAASHDLDKEKDLFQYVVSVVASGVPAGQTFTLDIVPKVGQSSQIFTENPADIPDGETGKVSFPQFDYPFDEVTLTASVSDPAGNKAKLVQKVRFFKDEASVGFYPWEYVEFKECSSSAECGIGTCIPLKEGNRCVVPWKSSSQLIKVTTGPELLFKGVKNLRFCSNHPSLSGEECVYKGYGIFHVIKTIDHSGGFESVLFSKAEVDALPQGKHHMFIEALRADTNEWMSSLESPNITEQERVVFVDTIPPTVESLSFPDDAEPSDGWLNSLEAVQGLPEHNVFAMNAAVSGAPGGKCTFYLNDVAQPPKTLSQAESEVVTAQYMLPQGANKVCAQAQDLVGNKSSQVCQQPKVDTIPPPLKFVSPNNAPFLLVGSSADVVLGTEPWLDVKLAIDHDGVLSSSSKKADAQGHVVFENILSSDGYWKLTASTADVAGNPKTATTTPPSILVDRTPPTVTISAPADGANLTPEDDADLQTSGYQVEVKFVTTDTAEWSIRTLRCDETFNNCEEPSLTTPTNVQDLGDGAFSVQFTASNLANSVEYRIVRVEVKDANGNSAFAEVKVSITLGDCAISFTNLPVNGFANNEVYCLPAGDNCDTAVLDPTVAVVGACAGADQVVFYVDHTPVDVSSDLAAGTITFPLEISDGETVILEAELVAGGEPIGQSTGEFAITADLTDPVPVIVAPDSNPFICNIAEDLNEGLDGCQVAVEVQVVDTNAVGGSVVLARTVGEFEFELDQTTMDANPFVKTFPSITFPEVTNQGLLLRATDLAGNTAETSTQVKADVTRPGIIILNPIDPDTDVNRRRPSVRLTWTAVADDGKDGSPASSYRFRYSTTPIDSQEGFDNACDPAELAGTAQPPVPGAPKSLESFEISGPDVRDPTDPCRFIVSPVPSTKYYFAVQAIDDAGNSSLFDPKSVQSTDQITLRYTRFLSAGLGATALGSQVSNVGDIDGDSMAEIALGGDTKYSGFCIVRGHASPAAQIDLADAGNPNIKCLKDSYSSWLGTYTFVGLGDVNGDGFGDVGVAAYRDETLKLRSEFRVYLGNDAGLVNDTPAVTFLLGGKFYQYAIMQWAGNFNADTTEKGKPLNDIVISVPELNRVFVVLGRSAWGGGPVTIDLLNPTDLEVWSVVVIDGVGMAEEVDYFGDGLRGVGNVLLDNGGVGTQYDDLAIGKMENSSAMYIIKGKPVSGTTTLTISASLDGSGTEDLTSVKIVPEPGMSKVNWFGGEIFGGQDVDGDGLADVGCSHAIPATPDKSYILLIYGSAINQNVGKTFQVAATTPAGTNAFKSASGLKFTGPWSFPNLAGNFDNAPSGPGLSLDLLLGDFQFKQPPEYGHVYIRLNQQEAAVDGALFPYVDIIITDPDNPASKSFAGWNVVPVGDFNNDGLPDILAGDKGTAQAVLIY